MGLFSRNPGPPPRLTGFEHQYVDLRPPRVPETDIKARLYTALVDIGLADVIFGPADIRACFDALSARAPIFRSTRSTSNAIGTLPGGDDILWYALQGPVGSAIVVSFGPNSDDDYRTHRIDDPLSAAPLPPPFVWGTIMGRGAHVPVGFAQIFADATLCELSSLPGLDHLRPAPPSPDLPAEGEPMVTLTTPHPSDPIGIGYRTMESARQSVLVYGATDLMNTFSAVRAAAPVFGATMPTPTDGWIGALPSPSVQWFGIEGQAGSAIVVTVPEGVDLRFVGSEVMQRVGTLEPEFTCGIAERITVPRSFARVFGGAVQRRIWELPGMGHLRTG